MDSAGRAAGRGTRPMIEPRINSSTAATPPASTTRYLPALSWLAGYSRTDLIGDLLAGLIVAIMLVPQSMAYALLAGLPPQSGLYASILPLIIYGLLGSSRVLAVGPVAIVSLMVASGISPLAAASSADYIQLAITLALLVGLIQTLMGLLRVGFLVNFLSYPVLAGFISAAAILIGLSQLKHLLGVSLPPTDSFLQTIIEIVRQLPKTNMATLAVGGGSLLVLLYFKHGLTRQLSHWRVPESWRMPITKSAPLIVVAASTLLVRGLDLQARGGIKVVGDVPAGLPLWTLPAMDLATWRLLLPTALAISLVGYMQSISVAKSLASKRRQRIDADQELIGLGFANLAATLTGGYPVTGGLSRSMVNYSAGANSGMASIITALIIALAVVFLVPLFYFLPQAALASIIIVAISSMVDLKIARNVWRYNRLDAVSLGITFVTVLAVGIEEGILAGAASTMLFFFWRTSKPHVAVVGRLGNSETFRNVLRHPVVTCDKVIAIRVDESLYYANSKFLEDTVLQAIVDQPQVKHFVLIGMAVNFIDASALETLTALIDELADAGVTFHLAEIKGPVMDRLTQIGFIDLIGEDRIHLSTHDAMVALGCPGPQAAG